MVRELLAAALRLEWDRLLEQGLRFVEPAGLCELIATPPERLAEVGADAGKAGRDLEEATQRRERVLEIVLCFAYSSPRFASACPRRGFRRSAR